MEGSQLPADCAGAFVSVYLGSTNIIEAIKSAEDELLQDRYRPLNTHGAFELDLEELDHYEEELPSNDELLNLRNNGGIWYGPFNCYPPEESQIQ